MDGTDFYIGEYIKDNFNLNPNHIHYPTIEHKVPIFYGYLLNIDIEYITSIDNLCRTTRSNNSRKSKKDIELFQKELNNDL